MYIGPYQNTDQTVNEIAPATNAATIFLPTLTTVTRPPVETIKPPLRRHAERVRYVGDAVLQATAYDRLKPPLCISRIAHLADGHHYEGGQK